MAPFFAANASEPVPPPNELQTQPQVTHLLRVVFTADIRVYKITVVELRIDFGLVVMLLIGNPIYGIVSVSCDTLSQIR
jgi:hypothetical protein